MLGLSADASVRMAVQKVVGCCFDCTNPINSLLDCIPCIEMVSDACALDDTDLWPFLVAILGYERIDPQTLPFQSRSSESLIIG